MAPDRVAAVADHRHDTARVDSVREGRPGPARWHRQRCSAGPGTGDRARRGRTAAAGRLDRARSVGARGRRLEEGSRHVRHRRPAVVALEVWSSGVEDLTDRRIRCETSAATGRAWTSYSDAIREVSSLTSPSCREFFPLINVHRTAEAFRTRVLASRFSPELLQKYKAIGEARARAEVARYEKQARVREQLAAKEAAAKRADEELLKSFVLLFAMTGPPKRPRPSPMLSSARRRPQSGARSARRRKPGTGEIKRSTRRRRRSRRSTHARSPSVRSACARNRRSGAGATPRRRRRSALAGRRKGTDPGARIPTRSRSTAIALSRRALLTHTGSCRPRPPSWRASAASSARSWLTDRTATAPRLIGRTGSESPFSQDAHARCSASARRVFRRWLRRQFRLVRPVEGGVRLQCKQ
jgi:hypothetical protein